MRQIIKLKIETDNPEEETLRWLKLMCEMNYSHFDIEVSGKNKTETFKGDFK